MKIGRNFIITLLLVGSLLSCKKVTVIDLQFLVGTWKIENKEQYEVWQLAGNNRLAGSVYQLNGEEKAISEELEIKMIDGKIIYEATVLDQNEGQTVPFTLNPTSKDWFSFENLDHDFPNKIRYQEVSGNELLVEILGTDGKGQSYIMLRQE